jgi:hypothetical protein
MLSPITEICLSIRSLVHVLASYAGLPDHVLRGSETLSSWVIIYHVYAFQCAPMYRMTCAGNTLHRKQYDTFNTLPKRSH